MKIGLFSDPHYYHDIDKETGGDSSIQRKIKQVMDHFKAWGAELCLCFGDLTDSENQDGTVKDPLERVMKVIDSYGIPFYCVPGNHDYLHYTAKDFLAISHTPELPFALDTPSHTLISLDANYRSDMRRYDVAGVDWTDANIPPEEVEFLKKTLEDSKKPCIVMVHQNLDFNVGWKSCIIKNSEEVRALLEASGKVELVIQGHFHPGCDNEIGGIRYFTVAGLYENETARFCTLEIGEGGCVIEKIE